MKIFNSFFLLLLTTALTNCSDDEFQEVQIRIRNSSTFDYSNVNVNTGGGEHSITTIEAGQTSNYRQFDYAYRYAFVELDIDGETFTVQPIDYVGETPLSSGKYTYDIQANESADQFGRLTLTLIVD